MPSQMLPSLLLYILVMGYTPGPSNLCAFHSGIHFGRAKAMNIWFGFLIGFIIIEAILIGAAHSLGEILGNYSRLIAYLGAAYMVFMAISILLRSRKPKEEQARSCTFRTGFLIEFTNAKVWLFCITALCTYVLPFTNSLTELAKVGLLLILAGPAANLVWLLMGSKLEYLTESHGKLIDAILAGLLIACAVLLLVG